MPSARCLVEDHAQLDVLLERLRSLLDAHALQGACDLLDLLWARLAVHIRAEHHQLFVALRGLPDEAFDGRDGMPTPGQRDQALRSLRADHDFFMDELGSGSRELRQLSEATDGTAVHATIEIVRDRVARVADRLGPHNRLEEEAVYLWPDRALDPGGRESLATSMQAELRRLPPRFTPTMPTDPGAGGDEDPQAR